MEAFSRFVDQVRGRVLHYSACIKHLRICCASLSRALGTDAAVEYDFPVPIEDELRELCAYMVGVLFQYGHLGQEMWPLPPSTLAEQFMSGILTDAIALITWDASIWDIRPLNICQHIQTYVRYVKGDLFWDIFTYVKVPNICHKISFKICFLFKDI